jgi:hypothetical protein
MHLLLTLATLFQLTAPAAVQQPEAGSGIEVYLVTMGPGDAIWEKFGHNAIWIRDPDAGTERAYNWGVFDFDQPRFVARFLRGHMLYTVASYDARQMIDHYVRDLNRSVWLQRLALTPSQSLELKAFLEWNELPENAAYRYDYFRDNCSTRARDAIDRALGGALRAELDAAPSGTTYRFHTRRLTAPEFQWYALLQVGLGQPGDDSLTRWEESFIPMRLSSHLRDVTVAGEDGTPRSLVASELTIHDAPGRVEPAEPPPGSSAGMAALGLLLGGMMVLAGWKGRSDDRPPRRLVMAGTIWSLLVGVTGVVLLLAWLMTDHFYMSRNATVLLASPVSLLVALALPLARRYRRWREFAFTAAWVVGGLAAVGALLIAIPGVGQRSGDVVALLLPAQVALVWGIVRGRVDRRHTNPADGAGVEPTAHH